VKKFTILLAVLLSTGILFGQKEANFWYFGEKAGLSFGLGLPTFLLDGQLDTWEGCSSISSETGNLVFYTDGMTVWNKNHLVMPNGTGLLGHNSSTQSGIIVPAPGNNNIYYIFTVDARDNLLANGLRYSKVDMTLAGGLGDVVASEKNVPLIAPACEKVTAVGHSDGSSTWVITHQWGTDGFYAYSVGAGGVNTTPVISNVGVMVVGDWEYSKGYIKASPDGSKLAIAHNTMNTVEIFNFNNSTGVISNPITDATYMGFDGGPYGVEFSPNSELLYIAEWKDNSKIHQYDLTAGTNQAILDSRIVVGTVAQGDDPIGALQLGPDNRLYCARWGNSYLSVITDPNVQGVGCNFVSEGVFLGGRESAYGLPPFIQSFFTLNVEFYYDPPCYELPTQFYMTSSDTPDSVLWDFGDPSSPNNTSTLFNPVHQYSDPGLYLVTLFAWISGHQANAFHLIVVHGPPEAELSADDLSIPYNTFTTLHATVEGTPGPHSFEWIPADKLVDPDTLHPQTELLLESTVFTLIVTDDATGCSTIETITINVTGSPLGVTASADPPGICLGEPSQLMALATGGTGSYTYQWTSDPFGFTSDLATPVVFPTETTEYYVTINDGYNNAESQVTVEVYPDLTADAGNDQTIPYGTSTTLNGSTSSPGSCDYYWAPEAMLINPGAAQPTTVDLTSNTMFTLWAVDQATGCESPMDTTFVFVDGGPLTVSAFINHEEVCYGTEVTVTASVSGGNPSSYQYTWTDDHGNSYPSANEFTTMPDATTTFYVTVTDGFTTQQANVSVAVNPVPDFSINTGTDTIYACPYDTVFLECSPLHDDWSYYWSNGAVTPDIKVGSTGIGYDVKTYTLMVESDATCAHEKDVVVIFDFGSCFGIDEQGYESPVTIYPNPASGEIHIDLDGQYKEAVLSIFDLSGKAVSGNKEYVSENGSLSIRYNTSLLENGIYIVRMVVDDRAYFEKLIISR
jgi:hypothetical protein